MAPGGRDGKPSKGRARGAWLPAVVVAGGLILAGGSFWLLIDSADFFRERSQRVAVDASEPDRPLLEVMQVHGRFEGPLLAQLTLTFRLAPAVGEADLGPLVLEMSSWESHATGDLASGALTIKGLRDSDGSLAAGTITQGDLVELQVDAPGLGFAGAPGQTISLSLHVGKVPSESEWTVPGGASGRLVLLERLA